jgi:hypothetical protein
VAREATTITHGEATLNISELTNDEIDYLLDRYRSYLAALDWERQFESRKNYRAYLTGKIRRLEGERERRRV